VKRSITAILAASLAVGGCEAMPGRPRPDARELAPTEVMAFATLYARNCAGCHGESGRLGAARALNDPVYLAVVPRERLRHVIVDGVPGTAQPPFALSAGGPLTDQQIDVLVAGIEDGWRRPGAVAGQPIPPYDGGRASGGEPGNADRGRGVFASACARCHGDDGRGSPRGGGVVDPSYLALVSDQHLRTTVIAGRNDLGMPDWRGDGGGAPLSSQQVSDVVAWLVAQRQAVPGRLP
jgi:mono/diheme cytochrome c family protein